MAHSKSSFESTSGRWCTSSHADRPGSLSSKFDAQKLKNVQRILIHQGSFKNQSTSTTICCQNRCNARKYTSAKGMVPTPREIGCLLAGEVWLSWLGNVRVSQELVALHDARPLCSGSSALYLVLKILLLLTAPQLLQLTLLVPTPRRLDERRRPSPPMVRVVAERVLQLLAV